LTKGHADIETLINKIRSSVAGRNQIIKDLYYDTGLKNSIRNFVIKKGGDQSDFEDVFNFTLVQFVKTVLTKKDFSISTPLNNYLFGIARNLLFQKLGDKLKNRTQDFEEGMLTETDSNHPEQIFLLGEKSDIVNRVLGNIGKRCKEVLMLWSMGYSMKEIAKEMNYKSEIMARKKKCLCLKELLLYLEANPQITEQLRP